MFLSLLRREPLLRSLELQVTQSANIAELRQSNLVAFDPSQYRCLAEVKNSAQSKYRT